MSKRTKWLSVIGIIAMLVLGWQIVAFASVSTDSGFEAADGNLAPQAPINFDWNSFAPTTWTGDAPYRTSDKVVSGWTFKGIEDDQKNATDTAFAGGTKQDDDCASVIGASSPNKDDMKRVYLSTKTINGDTFLNLAWVRIPQNTTSPSAHIAFEFNKGENGSCNQAGGLVKRTAGDLLIVYDFEGGATDNPVITLRRWVTSGACEVGNSTAPCWGPATNLTAAGFAEAKVNTQGSVVDDLAPPAPPATTSVSETLRTNEFGEAGINLTDAGVFQPNTCESFGTAFAVSRSSGNSGTAQMKDLVGPAPFNLQNCGTVKIIKQTNPRGLNQDFDFTSNLSGSQLSCDELSPDTATSFKLNDNGNAGKTLGSIADDQNSGDNTQFCSSVPVGNYTVSESDTDPAGFVFDSVTCTASGTGTSATTSGRTASITMAGGGSVTCVYINLRKASPQINTTPDPSSGTVGVVLNDSATLSEGFNPQGSIEFKLFAPGDNDCSGTPVFTETVTVDGNGTYSTTSGYTSDTVGTYRWTATYTSSNPNNNNAESGCQAEQVTISPAEANIDTVQELFPQDSATVSATAGGDPTGTVDFALYGPNDNDCSGTAAYTEENVALTNGTANTNNTTFSVKQADSGDYKWIVHYDGDETHDEATSECGKEVFTATIDNDTTN